MRPSVPVRVPLLDFGVDRPSADGAILTDMSGDPLASVAEAPPLLVRRLLARPEPAAARTFRMVATAGERSRVLAEAIRTFAEDTVAGESPQEYDRRFARATGIPSGVATHARTELLGLASELSDQVEQELAEQVLRYGGVRATVRRAPRGDLLSVVAPSNHPSVHGSWLRALAYGLRVAVRPGGRDPFTPLRLGRALARVAGDAVPLQILPGPHSSAGALLAQGDLGLVYGSGRTVREYRNRADIAVRGPGHSKAVLLGPVTAERIRQLAAAVSGDAGVRCTNVSTIYTDQNVEEVAVEVAAELAKLPRLLPTDPAAGLPVRTQGEARAMLADVRRRVGEAQLFGDTEPTLLADGSAVLHPMVVATHSADHPLIGVELPFPFVVIAPWRPADGLAPLRHSLVLVLIGADPDLARAATAEPGVHKVVTGNLAPWWTRPPLPHEGHLGDFLLIAKTRLEEISGGSAATLPSRASADR